MLTVKTYLAPSSIHGLGLFAAEPVPAGAVVWMFHPGADQVLSPETLYALPAAARAALEAYCYRAAPGAFVLCSDDARFMNHSDSPNTATGEGDTEHGATVAARDIAPGEELTCDYREFDLDWAEKLGVSPRAGHAA